MASAPSWNCGAEKYPPSIGPSTIAAMVYEAKDDRWHLTVYERVGNCEVFIEGVVTSKGQARRKTIRVADVVDLELRIFEGFTLRPVPLPETEEILAFLEAHREAILERLPFEDVHRP